MGANVEVPGDLVDFNVASESAPFTSLVGLLCLLIVGIIIEVGLVVVPALQHLPRVAEPVFNELAIEINDVGSNNVLNVKREDVTRDVWEVNIHVDHNLIDEEATLTF